MNWTKIQRDRPPDSLMGFLKRCDYVEMEICACLWWPGVGASLVFMFHIIERSA